MTFSAHVDGNIPLWRATIALTLSEYPHLRSFYQQKMSPGCLSCAGLGDAKDFSGILFVLRQHHGVTDLVSYIQVIAKATATETSCLFFHNVNF